MARRPKERLRTIQLDADVSEIAQRLADRKELSSTLSELLRVNYGFGDKLDEKKRELHVLLDHKQELIEQENKLYDEIEEMEKAYIHRESTIKPQIEKRLQLMRTRLDNATRDMNNAIDSTTRNSKHRVIENLTRLIAEAEAELEEFQ